MAAPEPLSRPTGGGHVRGLVVTLLHYVEARGKLFQIETQEAGSLLSKVVSWLIIALVLLSIAWMMAVPALIFLIAQALEQRWEYVALIGAGLHLVIGFLFLMAAIGLWKRSRLYAESINQFKKDREWATLHQPPPN